MTNDGTRLRNVSPLGAIEVPDLNRIVEFHNEVVVDDPQTAASLIESGHFTEVNKPGPKPTSDGAPTTADAPAAAPTNEEPTSDHAA